MSPLIKGIILGFSICRNGDRTCIQIISKYSLRCILRLSIMVVIIKYDCRIV